jgi:flagellar protein FliS
LRQRYLDMDLLTARAEVVLSRLFAKVLACARAAVAAERVAASRRDDLRRALDILAELRGSLDLAAGGELARNLDRLYEFASDRLLQAALGNSGEPIEEAIRVLEPLAEAWHELAARPLASPESSAA